MMKPKFHEPLPSFASFLKRLFKNILFGLLLIGVALYAGMLGYHFYEKMSWVDAFANAAMILAGMGPLTPLLTTGGKLFAGFYALFSGLFFILVMGIILSPVVHRFFHQLHLARMKEAGYTQN